ncbi:DNA polymerase III subunit alpha [Natroniella sulfidigena]|uniref:DNA polymerase III subunit alpha n=1 Tax=Natroniella sulfidigena TaxID=723921 RepID=UPI00200B1DE8|nr:DNA polymerase III subunit alpha [Natroniella sulfidigena]MCK8817910.1 DNA polymerase III subunit alpha [Natroniella sulfidigena]
MSQFVHLHVHTEYSLLDGAVKTEELIAQAKKEGMPAVAMTDHGVMYGAVEFYRQAKAAGVKPIIGCEVYITDNRLQKDVNNKKLAHLVLLAENNVGYRNLLKLVSQGYTEGFYYKPRIDQELLRENSEGLICLSSCLAGEISTLLANEQTEQAEEIALAYQDIFGPGNFFLELQDHGLKEEKRVNDGLVQLSKRLEIPLVATNDVHYLTQDDAKVHDILLCIQTGKDVNDQDRLQFPNDQFYFKSSQEMEQLFADYPQAIANTVEIADRCEVDLDFEQILLPHYEVPAGETVESYLRKLTYQGVERKYGELTSEVEERIEHELGIINQMGYPAYFLIVRDFIKYAKDEEIIVGPGRGSAASSIVSYLLDITEIDPLEYNLLFERFLNPARVSMPDIDIDFCYERRDEVIDYVTEKYGADKVAQIITFGTMAAKGAVRDVGRVLGISYDKTDKVAKAIPNSLGITLKDALEESDELQKLYNSDSEVKELIDYSQRIEGLKRHASTHAAGVVITKEELTNYTPLYQSKGEVTTQYDMDTLEQLGLLKMDFLGLRTLTVIDKALSLINENRANDLTPGDLSFDDPAVFELLGQGLSLGVFQLESDGMRRLIKQLKPENIEDIIALLALYRPGPLGSGMVDDFIARRHGEQEVEYPHPDLKEILEPTYGVILYQEQVMQIVQQIAGYSLGEADILRRSMGKKKPEVMKKHRSIFINGNGDIPGAVNNGYSQELAEELFELIEYFSGYGFNKAHSTAYAYVSYQTAYLKAHYPVEFMAALLTSIIGNSDKVAEYILEAERMEIEILPPDVNHSRIAFTVEGGKIRFGLKGIKNVGQKAIEEIIAVREEEKFSDLFDFCQRVDLSKVNKRVVESLIKAGAFDSLGNYRSQLLKVLPDAFAQAQRIQQERSNGQTSFLDLFEQTDDFMVDQVELPEIEEFDQQKLLALEKEMLGLYLSGHPLEQHLDKLEEKRNKTSQEIKEGKERAILGGLITNNREIITKNQRQMSFLTVEDEVGDFEVIVFPDTYQRYQEFLLEDEPILVTGRVNQEGKVIADKIGSLTTGDFSSSSKKEPFHLQLKEFDQQKLVELKDLLIDFSGMNPVYLHLIIEGYRVSIRLAAKYNLNVTPKLRQKLSELKVKHSF